MAAAPLGARRSRSSSAGGASFVAGGRAGPGPTPEPCRAQTKRRRHFALLRETGREALAGGRRTVAVGIALTVVTIAVAAAGAVAARD